MNVRKMTLKMIESDCNKATATIRILCVCRSKSMREKTNVSAASTQHTLDSYGLVYGEFCIQQCFKWEKSTITCNNRYFVGSVYMCCMWWYEYAPYPYCKWIYMWVCVYARVTTVWESERMPYRQRQQIKRQNSTLLRTYCKCAQANRNYETMQ